MQNLNFPINFVFNIGTLANDFTASDTHGNTIAYVKQKMFKFKEDISIYDSELKTNVLYKIKADRWIDFSAAYSIQDVHGNEIGKIARKGWRSLWKAKYEIIDQFQKAQYIIEEENGWVKVMDSLMSEIPLVGIVSGYIFNPSYKITDAKGKDIARIKKEASFWGRKFEITKLNEFDADDGVRIMLSLMMMILLERRRG